MVSFLVFRAKGASDVEVGDLVAEKLRQLSEANPNVTYTLIDDTISYIANTYRRDHEHDDRGCDPGDPGRVRCSCATGGRH